MPVTLRPATIALDVGETLIDETGQWTAWAGWLGVSPFTLMVALGAILEQGKPFKKVFALFDEKFDIDAEIARRDALGTGYQITAAALHPDVRPALTVLATGGVRVAIAGTMTPAEQTQIAGLGLPVTDVISHTELGHTNREPAFFGRLAARLRIGRDDLRYVSHRQDKVGPAAAEAGIELLWLRRGPLAAIRRPAAGARWSTAADSLSDIAGALVAGRPYQEP